MELKVNDYQLPESIAFNYEELKQALIEKCRTYESIIYTDDRIKEAKADKANLNKLKKALNDEIIRREREYMKPFNDFKKKIIEIIEIIDVPVQTIDNQIKAFEEQQKADKMDSIKEYWSTVEHPDGLALEEIFDAKWLNATTSMKSIQEAIHTAVDKYNADIETIRLLPEFAFEAEQIYISTLDLQKAISEAKKMAEIAKKKAEREEAMRKIEEEQKAKAAEAEFAKNMNPPIEEVAATEEVVPPAAPEKHWISFSAYLTVEDAQALKQFFKDRNIEYKAV